MSLYLKPAFYLQANSSVFNRGPTRATEADRSWDNEFVWQLTGTRLFGVAWSVFKGPAVAVDTSTDWRGHLSCLWFCKTNHHKSVTESTYAFHMPHQEPEHRRGCTDGHGSHEIVSYFFKPRARPMFGNDFFHQRVQKSTFLVTYFWFFVKNFLKNIWL